MSVRVCRVCTAALLMMLIFFCLRSVSPSFLCAQIPFLPQREREEHIAYENKCHVELFMVASNFHKGLVKFVSEDEHLSHILSPCSMMP